MAADPSFWRTLPLALCLIVAAAQAGDRPETREQIVAQTMHPYKGASVPGVDTHTLTGKVMCGYQGWFSAEGDGCKRHWNHWQGDAGFKPGSCKIDLWPDMTELDPDERYATPFKLADGRTAEVFSSFNRKTVLRHFKWMQQYGIDGVFVQRFATEISHPAGFRQVNTVLAHCREGANTFGRAYAVMYDITGMDTGRMKQVIADWKLLIDEMHITEDPAYLKHGGKPVVAVWGLGFTERKYTLDEGAEFVGLLKGDSAYGRCTVMLGVPTFWRTLDRDCVKDPKVLELIQQADIVSPWSVGRYATPAQASEYAATTMSKDIAWCKEHGREYLPVVFPGFSWHNMNPDKRLNEIPRLGGRFLWSQFAGAKKAGATMAYQAMFDEVDEATAIFKCTNDPPVGESTFATYEGLPSDHYLKLAGQAARMFKNEIPYTEKMP